MTPSTLPATTLTSLRLRRQARQENAIGTYVLPITTALLTRAVAAYAVESVRAYVAALASQSIDNTVQNAQNGTVNQTAQNPTAQGAQNQTAQNQTAQNGTAQGIPDGTAQDTQTALALLARAPQTLNPAVSWAMVNVRPYTCVFSSPIPIPQCIPFVR